MLWLNVSTVFNPACRNFYDVAQNQIFSEFTFQSMVCLVTIVSFLLHSPHFPFSSLRSKSMSARDDTRSRLRPFGIVFEKSLHDLIRGIRTAKDPTARETFLRDALADCRAEVRSPDMDTKTMAVLKLTYLEMYGFDMSWASFNVLEVMSNAKFQRKRVGYLAAMQSFRSDSDVLMLATNLFKKDLSSSQHLEVSVALGGIASVVTPSLAQEVSDDIIKMLNHSKPYIRKKAVLALHKIFLQYPEALQQSFARLKEKLQDPDPSVVSATVNVICELAKQSKAAQKTYIALAPQLYELLTNSKNNWMLIKILKLFSLLAPSEPRLKGKLLPQIIQLMESTTAMSLLYECINCIASGDMIDENDYELAALCIGKLRIFLQEEDQNLKYVGLLALSKIVGAHPQFVSDFQDIILDCMDDPDLSIRERVLIIISGIVNEDNIYHIVNKLLGQLREPNERDSYGEGITQVYRIQVIEKILEICSKRTYALIPDFEWFADVLVELVSLANGADQVGALIGEQLRNVAVRVRAVREKIVGESLGILQSSEVIPSVIPCAVWVIGEYAECLPYPVHGIEVIAGLHVGQEEVYASCVQAVVKVYCKWASQNGWTPGRADQIVEITDLLIAYLEKHSTATVFEVQERAASFLELLKLVKQGIQEHPSDASEPPLLLTLALPSMFNAYELNPVAPSSQRKIAVPDDLDLDTSIYPPMDISDDEEDEIENLVDIGGGEELPAEEPLDEEETERRRQERLDRRRDDPFYISIPSSNNTPSMSPAPTESARAGDSGTLSKAVKYKPPRKVRVEIIQDEAVEGDESGENNAESSIRRDGKGKKPLFKLESRLADLDLDSAQDNGEAAFQVDRLREELYAKQGPVESVIVTHKKVKKKKKKKKAKSEDPVKSEETENA